LACAAIDFGECFSYWAVLRLF